MNFLPMPSFKFMIELGLIQSLRQQFFCVIWKEKNTSKEKRVFFICHLSLSGNNDQILLRVYGLFKVVVYRGKLEHAKQGNHAEQGLNFSVLSILFSSDQTYPLKTAKTVTQLDSIIQTFTYRPNKHCFLEIQTCC